MMGQALVEPMVIAAAPPIDKMDLGLSSEIHHDLGASRAGRSTLRFTASLFYAMTAITVAGMTWMSDHLAWSYYILSKFAYPYFPVFLQATGITLVAGSIIFIGHEIWTRGQSYTGVISKCLMGCVNLVLLVRLLDVASIPPYVEARGKLLQTLSQTAVPATFQRNRELQQGKRLMANLLTFGDLRPSSPKDNSAFSVAQNPFLITFDPQLLDDLIAKTPGVFIHELFHLRPSMLTWQEEVQKANADFVLRILKLNDIDPTQPGFDLSQNLSQLLLASQKFWNPQLIKENPGIKNDVWIILHHWLTDEIQAYYGQITLLDFHKPKGQTVQEFTRNRLEQVARERGTTFKDILTQALSQELPSSDIVNIYVVEYFLAQGYEAGSITPAFEDRVVEMLAVLRADNAKYVTMYAQAEFDPDFSRDKALHSYLGDKTYAKRFSQWMRDAIVRNPNEHFQLSTLRNIQVPALLRTLYLGTWFHLGLAFGSNSKSLQSAA